MTEPLNLQGKNALVTGAAVGLGLSYAKALAQRGVNIAITDQRDDIFASAELCTQLAAQQQDIPTPKIIAWQGDVADPEHVRTVVDGAADTLGGIDILVNNAGVWGASVADDPLHKTLRDYDRIVGTNLKGEYLFGRAVASLMIEQRRGGDIVNIATDHMVTCGTPHNVCPQLPQCPWRDSPRPTGGGDAMDLYDASKWALNGFLYAWAKSLAPHNIRVNQFCMGATDSHMLRSFHKFQPSPEEEASWMSADENAQALIDLLQEGFAGRNAQNINFCVGRPVKLEAPLPHIYVAPQDVTLGSDS
jgi:3-oxoacyl-[acyl-carrier protein] reductase